MKKCQHTTRNKKTSTQHENKFWINSAKNKKKKCFCRTEEWAGNFNKITCLNCVRKVDLENELKNKGFWTELKDLKYWKIRRQGQYKKLKIAPVYPTN